MTTTTWEDDYRSGAEYLQHRDGVPWWKEPGLKWWQRILHRHEAQTRGNFNFHYVERCRCGAYGPSPWVTNL